MPLSKWVPLPCGVHEARIPRKACPYCLTTHEEIRDRSLPGMREPTSKAVRAYRQSGKRGKGAKPGGYFGKKVRVCG